MKLMWTSLLFASVVLAGCWGTPSLPTVHTVVQGDTLSEISMKYYGTMVHWERIAETNEIDDPRELQVGVELVIPAIGE